MDSGTTTPPVTSLDPGKRAGDSDDTRYPGGKGVSGFTQWICDRLPTHVYYAEPFCGKAAVFRMKAPALRTWLIDSDESTIGWWRRRTAADPLARCDDAGLRVTREPRQSRRGHVEVIQGCGIRFCELAAEWAIPDLLVYLDPPYLLSTRSKKSIYRHEMTDRQHERLLTAANAICGPVVISGYWSALYSDLLADWKCETREVITRGGTMRTECLWRNRAATARASTSVSMEYSDLGTDWRERDRVGKKIRRWVANYLAMPTRERRAILLSLLDAENRRLPRRK